VCELETKVEHWSEAAGRLAGERDNAIDRAVGRAERCIELEKELQHSRAINRLLKKRLGE
jgi:hypothetical protein